MKVMSRLYDFYKKTLTDNGWLNADTANVQSASQSGGVDIVEMLAKNYAKKVGQRVGHHEQYELERRVG